MSNEIEPSWLGSLFGIIAFAISCLVFVYLNIDFFYATLKIIIISICFYLFGMVLAIIFNYLLNTNKDNNQKEV